MMQWKTSRRTLDLSRPLVMGILNITPDSFSDGGQHSNIDAALRRVAEMVSEDVDIIDIGGESTRPGSDQILSSEEIDRVVPVIERIHSEFDTPISIDTTKSPVAAAALSAGAEIINDVSGLRFDRMIAGVAARSGAGLVLMHSRGGFSEMHAQPRVDDILAVIIEDFRRSVKVATDAGVQEDMIVLDAGIGFGKSFEQNLELIAKLDKLKVHFPQYPMLIGASRKSFIGKVLDGAPTDRRLSGSLAAAAIAVWNGASILRVHDVNQTRDVVRVVTALRNQI
jgi:dihydropteroate synthase